MRGSRFLGCIAVGLGLSYIDSRVLTWFDFRFGFGRSGASSMGQSKAQVVLTQAAGVAAVTLTLVAEFPTTG